MTNERPSVETKPMASPHLDAVVALWKATEGLVLTDSDNPRDLSSYLERNPGMSHIAVQSEKVVGAVLCGHDGRRGYLHHLAVAADSRGKGIGRSLVEACLQQLANAGITQCNLFIVDEHQPGRDFWQNAGWREWPGIRLMSKAL